MVLLLLAFPPALLIVVLLLGALDKGVPQQRKVKVRQPAPGHTVEAMSRAPRRDQ